MWLARAEQMDLVVGATKLGLYEVGKGVLHIFSLKKELLLVPITAVAECAIGETHLLRADRTIRLVSGLELDWGSIGRRWPPMIWR